MGDGWMDGWIDDGWMDESSNLVSSLFVYVFPKDTTHLHKGNT